ncbi:hypothetical protein EVAR_24739_1 [Eumeta japonica]|uniref:Uncharacterized protein n=1 Tax=Eumeta variegata TaxID=151549 RepID=A0A4C1VD57_EUMVA|nr:hypothetical protein EVAR_24739_1 [Eumeta japonica]
MKIKKLKYPVICASSHEDVTKPYSRPLPREARARFASSIHPPGLHSLCSLRGFHFMERITILDESAPGDAPGPEPVILAINPAGQATCPFGPPDA